MIIALAREGFGALARLKVEGVRLKVEGYNIRILVRALRRNGCLNLSRCYF